jgi:CRP-like cAMP-binding protein
MADHSGLVPLGGEALATLRAQLEADLPDARPDTISTLTRAARVRIVPPGEPIYREGEPVPLTLVVAGYGAALRTTADGKEFVSGIARPGALFGWSGVASVPSSIQLLALTDCQVIQWPGSQIRPLVLADPGLASAAIESMAWSLHQTVERIEGFLHQDARLRVLKVLAQYRALFFGDPPVLSRTHLPGLVGTSREMTGHVLRQLEHEGTVRRVGRFGLELLRPDQLDGVGAPPA